MQEMEDVNIVPITDLMDALCAAVFVARAISIRKCTLDEYVAALKTSINSLVSDINI